MGLNHDSYSEGPSRAAVDALAGPVVIEFGVPWCPHCQGAQPLIAEAFKDHPAVAHLRVEDGKGRPLGRSYSVKLWPALIFLRDGVEVSRLVRPAAAREIAAALAAIDAVSDAPAQRR